MYRTAPVSLQILTVLSIVVNARMVAAYKIPCFDEAAIPVPLKRYVRVLDDPVLNIATSLLMQTCRCERRNVDAI